MIDLKKDLQKLTKNDASFKIDFNLVSISFMIMALIFCLFFQTKNISILTLGGSIALSFCLHYLKKRFFKEYIYIIFPIDTMLRYLYLFTPLIILSFILLDIYIGLFNEHLANIILALLFIIIFIFIIISLVIMIINSIIYFTFIIRKDLNIRYFEIENIFEIVDKFLDYFKWFTIICMGLIVFENDFDNFIKKIGLSVLVFSVFFESIKIYFSIKAQKIKRGFKFLYENTLYNEINNIDKINLKEIIDKINMKDSLNKIPKLDSPYYSIFKFLELAYEEDCIYSKDPEKNIYFIFKKNDKIL